MGIGLFLKISHIISYSPSEKVFISESIISFFLIFKDSKVSTCRSVKLTRQTLTTLSSVIQLCPALCDPMDCSMPGLPVHHQLLELAQMHVHWVGDAIQPSHPLSSPSRPAFNFSQNQGLFKWVHSLHQVAKVLQFQHQHQSFQWALRTDFIQDELVGSPCSPKTLKT